MLEDKREMWITRSQGGYKHLGTVERVVTAWLSSMISEQYPLASHVENSIMASVAVTDFKNYIKYKEGLIGEADADYVASSLLNKWLDENPIKLKSMLENWLEDWLYKWKQRVRLVWKQDPGQEETSKKVFKYTDPIWLDLPIRESLKDMVIGSLVSIGEICFTNVVAESLIRGELYKYRMLIGDDEKALDFLEKSPVTLLNDVLAKVSKLRHHHEPVVVLKVDERVLKAPVEKIVGDRDRENGRRKSRWRSLFNFF